MVIEHTKPTFAKGVNEPATVRNLSATHRKIDIQKQLDKIDREFMSIAFKANRAERQRNERRAKRR